LTFSVTQTKEDEEATVTQLTRFVAGTMIKLWSWLEPNFYYSLTLRA